MEPRRLAYLPVALLMLAAAVVVSAGRVDARIPCPDGSEPDAVTGTCHRGGTGDNARGSSDGSEGSGGGDGGGGGGSGDGGGGEPEPPSPEEIARAVQQRLLLEVSTFLPTPDVATNPGEGRPSIIDIPTFFAMDNWLPQQTDRVTDPGTGYYIQVVSTPSLSLDPGEPGAPIIRCEDGGTRFDPNGPSPREQAARRGACAYTYTRRTGAAGRPDHWTARLMVSWTLEWTSNLPVPLPADLATADLLTGTEERQVDEINTVVGHGG